jgi:hypothetical protein
MPRIPSPGSPASESGQPGNQTVTEATAVTSAQQSQPPQPPQPVQCIGACDDDRPGNRPLWKKILVLAFAVWIVGVVWSLYAALGTLITAEPGPYITPIGGSDVPYIIGIGVGGFFVVTGYVVIVLNPLALWLRLLSSLAVVTLFVAVFSSVYYVYGNAVSPRDFGSAQQHKLPPTAYEGFGEPISKVDAIYFTVGTLTTAGTGSLNAKSEEIRIIAIIQMTLGVGLLTVGIAGFMKDRPPRPRSSPMRGRAKPPDLPPSRRGAGSGLPTSPKDEV